MSHPAAFFLQARAVGEPVPAEVEAHVARCDTCTSHIEALISDAAAYRAMHTPELLVRQVKRKAADRTKRMWVAALGVALAAALIMVVVPRTAEPESVRFKGQRFQVFVMRDGTPRLATETDRVRPGDVLRFAYHPPQPGYLMVLELDQTGRQQVFYPFEGQAAAAVSPSGDALLSGAVALDASAGPEHLVALFSPTPFTIEQAAVQVRARGVLAPQVDCAAPCVADRLTFIKESAP